MNKITVIGTGSVGSTIAYTLTINGLASEIVMIDINAEKAKGEALDIRQGTPFCSPCTIYAGTFEDAKNYADAYLHDLLGVDPGGDMVTTEKDTTVEDEEDPTQGESQESEQQTTPPEETKDCGSVIFAPVLAVFVMLGTAAVAKKKD